MQHPKQFVVQPTSFVNIILNFMLVEFSRSTFFSLFIYTWYYGKFLGTIILRDFSDKRNVWKLFSSFQITRYVGIRRLIKRNILLCWCVRNKGRNASTDKMEEKVRYRVINALRHLSIWSGSFTIMKKIILFI